LRSGSLKQYFQKDVNDQFDNFRLFQGASTLFPP
jgi:hypothetical protein